MKSLVVLVVFSAACGGGDLDGAYPSGLGVGEIIEAQLVSSDPGQAGGPVHDYRSNPAGDVLAAASATPVPFDWTINFDSNLRGRDMKSSTGKFCNRYRNDYVQNSAATPKIYITLVRNVSAAPDVRYTTFSFPNDGGLYSACWAEHDSSKTYHFDYSVGGGIGYDVRGHGTAYR